MPKPIDVGVLRLSTVFQLDNHTGQLLRSKSLNVLSTHHMQHVKLRLSFEFPYSIHVPTHFQVQHSELLARILSWTILVVDNICSLLQCSSNKECVPVSH